MSVHPYVYCGIQAKRFDIKTLWDPGSVFHPICVRCTGSKSQYFPARLTGHPDTWVPAEGGEIEDFKAFIDGIEITEPSILEDLKKQVQNQEDD